MTKDMAITKLIRALQDAGMQCVHIPSSTVIVELGPNERIAFTVGMVKKRGKR